MIYQKTRYGKSDSQMSKIVIHKNNCRDMVVLKFVNLVLLILNIDNNKN